MATSVGMDVLDRRSWQGALAFARWLLVRRRGRAALEAMLSQGVPAELRRPLEFLMGSPLDAEEIAVSARVESLRRALRRSGGTVEAWTTRTAADALGRGPEVVRRGVPLRYVGAVGSIAPYWGGFLLLCAKSLRARTLLELGACAGISSAYLASAPSCSALTTVEGSPELAQLASRNLAALGLPARVVNQPFDGALDAILPALPAPLDLVFVDGEHTRAAQQRYFERLWPHVREGGVALFDDIRWDAAVEAGWRELAHAPLVDWAIDLGRIGLCVRGAPGGAARYFDFSRFTTFWLPRPPRAPWV